MGDVLGRRIAAALIDVAILFVLLFFVAGVFGNETAADASISAKVRGGPALLFFLLSFAYFFGTELASAQTLGKRVMKLRVVRADGTRAGAGPVFVRNLVRFVDWLPFFYLVGLVAVFATGKRRLRVGDIAAKTTVIAADAPPPPPPEDRDRPGDDDVLAQVLR